MSSYDDSSSSGGDGSMAVGSPTSETERAALLKAAKRIGLSFDPITPHNAASMEHITNARVGRILDQNHIRPSRNARFWYTIARWPRSDQLSAGAGFGAHRLSVTACCRSFQARMPAARPFTDDELGVLAGHASTALEIVHIGSTVGASLFFYCMYAGRRRFRFPGHTPKWKLASPDVFPLHGAPLLHGDKARIAWQCARAISYGLVIGVFVDPFFQAYSNTRTMVVMASDPKLKALTAENKAARTLYKKGAISTQGDDLMGSVDKRIQEEIERQSSRPRQDEQHDGANGSQPDWGWKENSDTSGSEAHREQEPQEQKPQSFQDRIAAARKRYRDQQRGATAASDREAQLERDRAAERSDDPLRELGIDDLDASPVAPEADEYPRRSSTRDATSSRSQKKTRQTQQSGEDGMSAWERVRQQAREQSERNEKT